MANAQSIFLCLAPEMNMSQDEMTEQGINLDQFVNHVQFVHLSNVHASVGQGGDRTHHLTLVCGRGETAALACTAPCIVYA